MALLDGMETLGVVLLYYSSRCRWGQEEEERRGGGGGGRERERLKVKGGTRDVVGLVVDSLPKTFQDLVAWFLFPFVGISLCAGPQKAEAGA